MKNHLFRRLDARGLAHFVAPLLIVMLVGIVGTYLLVGTHATSISSKKHTSTYYLYSSSGEYKRFNITSSGFNQAQCGSHKLNGKKHFSVKKVSKNSNGSYKAYGLVCVTPPKAGDAYYITFGSNTQHDSTTVKIDNSADQCLFVHSNVPHTSAAGVTIVGISSHVLPKANGACVRDAATPADDGDTPSKDATPAKKKSKKIIARAATAAVSCEDTTRLDRLPSVSKLKKPPHFKNKPDSNGYYQLPNPTASSPYKLRVSGNARDHQYGSKELIRVFYTVAVAYHKAYPHARLVAGDLNAYSGHETHRNGIDIDVTESRRNAAVSSTQGGSDCQSRDLAKLFFNTGYVKFILFNDRNVINATNKYTESNTFHGILKSQDRSISYQPIMIHSNSTHDYHFHVRITAKPGSCIHNNDGLCNAAENLFEDRLEN